MTVPGAGIKSFSVFGEIGLPGMTSTMAKLRAFNTAGAKSGRTMATMTTGAATLAKGFTAVGVAAGVMAGASAVHFAKFDHEMTTSMAIMGDVSEVMEKDMVQAARTMARETTHSVLEMGKAYFFLASAGLSAEAQIASLPTVARFAQAGNFDLALATDLLTDAQSALGLTIRDDVNKNMENMIRLSDVLVKANTIANATVQQFSESLTNRAGAALKLVNKDVEEGVAVLAAMADQGIKAAEAGTRLDIVMRDLQTKAAKNAVIFKEAGVEVFNAAGNMNNMADIIEDLENAMASMSDMEKRIFLGKQGLGFADRSVAATLTLIGLSDAIREYEVDLRNAGGKTQDVADRQVDSLIGQLKLLKGEIGDVALTIGSKFEPRLRAVTEGLRGLVFVLGQANNELAAMAGQNTIDSITQAWDNLAEPSRVSRLEDLQKALEDVAGTSLFGRRGISLSFGAERGAAAARGGAAGVAQVDFLAAIDQLAFEDQQRIRAGLDIIVQRTDLSRQQRAAIELYLDELPRAQEPPLVGYQGPKSFDRLRRGDKAGGLAGRALPLTDLQRSQAETNRREALEDLRVEVQIGVQSKDALLVRLREELVAHRENATVRRQLLIEIFELEQDLADQAQDALDARTREHKAVLADMESRPEYLPAFEGGLDKAWVRVGDRVQKGLSRTVLPAVETELDEFGEIGTDAGRNLVDGIIGGMFGRESALEAAVKRIAQQVLVKSFLLFLGIASPSKEGRGIGANFVDGLILGMTGRQAELRLTSMQTAAVMAHAATSYASGASSPGGVASGSSGAIGRLQGPTLQLDVQNLPAPIDPRQAARDPIWVQFLSDSNIAVRERGGF